MLFLMLDQFVVDAEKYSKLIINHIYQARLCLEE
jgi:hypothetical protein